MRVRSSEEFRRQLRASPPVKRARGRPGGDHRAESPDALANLHVAEARVAEQDPRPRAVREIGREAVDAHAARSGSRNDGLLGNVAVEPKHHVRRGTVTSQRDAIAKMLSNGLEQRGVTCGALAQNTTEMALVES